MFTIKQLEEMRGKKIQNKVLRTPEKILHGQVCDYINLQYPNVIFLTDPSGLRLTWGLRLEMRRKKCRAYKIPDLIILEPRGGYHGLVFEIKVSVEDVYKKDLTFKKSEHVEAQAKSINRLNELGYKALFGIGFDHCKKTIDEYLKT